MALYAIGDLHLSLGPADKPMDVFGGRWTGYMEKLRENLKVIGPEDTTVLLGDLSWAMSLDDAADDFSFINAIPGRKIILKGNHDYWWTTLRAFDRFCAEHGFADFHVLNNSCFFYGDIALCGTRGWFYDAQKEGSHDEKIFPAGAWAARTLFAVGGRRGKILLPALSAALPRVRLFGDSGAARNIRRDALLLRPPARRLHPAGAGGRLSGRAVPPCFGGSRRFSAAEDRIDGKWAERF